MREHLTHVDGVMIGREAYRNPWILAEIEECLLSGRTAQSRAAIVEAYLPYVADQLARGVRLHSMTRHILGLFAGQPGARAWRGHLSRNASAPSAGIPVIRDALGLVTDRRGQGENPV